MKNEVKKGWWAPEALAAFEKLLRADAGNAQPKALAATAS